MITPVERGEDWGMFCLFLILKKLTLIGFKTIYSNTFAHLKKWGGLAPPTYRCKCQKMNVEMKTSFVSHSSSDLKPEQKENKWHLSSNIFWREPYLSVSTKKGHDLRGS